jgi:hypothetical protein
MTNSRRVAALVAALLALTGCDGGPKVGDVRGTVTVDGQTPALGSSITFVPTDGTSGGGGATIMDGRYSAKLPVGKYKVEIRVPRQVGKAPKAREGPGPGGVANIEESLPAKYNDQTELTLEVKPGANEKNWELKTK